MKKIGDKAKSTLSSPDPQREMTPLDSVRQRLQKEYGAVLVARGGAIPPTTIVFKDDQEVCAFQAGLPISSENIEGHILELQAAAMSGLKAAVKEAKENRLAVTPRGANSARRSYGETETLWASRINPGLDHWVKKGKVTKSEAARIRALSPFEQVPEIFKLEAKGIFFSKDLLKPVIYSVAPPGASQHLSMLALDVTEHENAKVRKILARHGWFQTVVSDLPHFTYLGAAENELPGLGLKKVINCGRSFWVPE